MTSKKVRQLKGSLDKDAKAAIHKDLDAMIERTASDLGATREVVAREVYYRMQRHPDPDLRRNPTTAEKRRAFRYWAEACQRSGCTEPLNFGEAEFHHLARGVQDQHAPANLLPYHAKCHAAEHSLSRDVPKRRR
jgi:hypothetical protein